MNDMRQGNCALCGHDEVIESTPKDFSGDDDGKIRPLAVAHGMKKVFLVGFREDADRPMGILSTYTCRKCGFTQWFVARPAMIKIDDVDTRIIKGTPPAETPYR
jgi:hypothetical protein